MSTHLIDGEFQSDKYPSTPRGKVPLSCKDVTAQDLLWEYAQRRRVLDAEFSDDLQAALKLAGFLPHHRPAAPVRDMPDVWGAAVERWIEAHVRGGPLEPVLLDVRNALPHLYEAFAAELVRTDDADTPTSA